MIKPVNDQLRSWLQKDGWAVIPDTVTVDDEEWGKHRAAVEKRPESERDDAATYRCLTFDRPVATKPQVTKPETILLQQDQLLKAFYERTDAERSHRNALMTQIGEVRTQVSVGQANVTTQVSAGLRTLGERVAALESTVHHEWVAQEKSHEWLVANVVTTEDVKKWGTRALWFSAGVLLLLILGVITGYAQNVNEHIVVATCGTPPSPYPAAGQRAPATVDTNGNECSGVTVTATVATAGLAVSATVGVSSAGIATNPSGGVAATAAPSWSNGTIVPFSFELDGDLRVAATVTPAANQIVSTTSNQGSGAVAVVGAASSATAAVGSPVLIAAMSGANAQSLVMTTSGSGLKVDGSGYTQPVSGTVTVGTFPDNEPFNLAQINGVATTTGSGTSASTLRVVLATPDPCTAGFAKAYTAISLTTSSQVVTGAVGQYIHICSINIGPIGTATNVAVVSGTGTVCATSIGGVFGGTTAATGWNFAANGGIALGNGGATVGRIDTTGENLCILVSAANQISGHIVTALSP